MYAAKFGNFEIAKLLKRAEAGMKTGAKFGQIQEGSMAIDFAKFFGATEIVSLLSDVEHLDLLSSNQDPQQ